MMGAALPQAPAQTGLASILAALGQGAPSGNASNQPGFEQLFAETEIRSIQEIIDGKV